ncbi:hypothetical protein QTP88_024202 [Uroleucon formosanum]
MTDFLKRTKRKKLEQIKLGKCVDWCTERRNHEVFSHIPKEKRRKWDQKGRKSIFVGYSEETIGYRICFGERDIPLSRDVIFKKSTNRTTTTEVKIINEAEGEEINLNNAAENIEDKNDEEEKLDDDKQMPVEVED